MTVTENASSPDPVLVYLERQQSCYSRHSGRNQFVYKVLKLAQIAFAATIPVLAAIGVSSWAAAVLGSAIVVIEGIQQLNQHQELWITYRTTAEALRREGFLYGSRAGPYATASHRGNCSPSASTSWRPASTHGGAKCRSIPRTKDVRDRTVSVELARPGESLGTFLVQNSKGYEPGAQHRGDPLTPKGAMLHDILGRRDMADLPIDEPTGIFVDGTDQLWEDAGHPDGPGNYVNTYDNLDQEGTYTFRFYIEAVLPDGALFDQVMTLSRWVGVDVDPIGSGFSVDLGLRSPSGMNAARVVVTPVDARKQYLGPFWDGQLKFHTTAGRFRPDPTPRFDGTYSRELVYPKGTLPVVTVTVQGKPMPPFVVATGCLGLIVAPLQKLYRRLLAFAAKTRRKRGGNRRASRVDDDDRPQ